MYKDHSSLTTAGGKNVQADLDQRHLARLREELPKSIRDRLGCYATGFLITHSTGLYDQTIYVSELMIAKHRGPTPSYCVSPGSSLFEVFKAETFTMLRGAEPLFGSSGPLELFPEAADPRDDM
jgi:hypothetical protein